MLRHPQFLGHHQTTWQAERSLGQVPGRCGRQDRIFATKGQVGSATTAARFAWNPETKGISRIVKVSLAGSRSRGLPVLALVWGNPSE